MVPVVSMFEYVATQYKAIVSKKFEGQGMVEYALILALVSVVAIAVLALIGPEIQSVFSSVLEKLQAGGGGAEA